MNKTTNEKRLGLGVMINILAGNEESVNTLTSSVGKTIVSAELDDDVLILKFDDGCGIKVWDDGQTCCERRYMVSDDDLSSLVGNKLVGMVVKDASPIASDGEEHEVQFLDVVTDKVTVQFATHNEHNGYYGGFCIKIEPIK